MPPEEVITTELSHINRKLASIEGELRNFRDDTQKSLQGLAIRMSVQETVCRSARECGTKGNNRLWDIGKIAFAAIASFILGRKL